jgi:hypothetical protein
MSPSSQQGSNKERFWRRVVRQWRNSGLSVRAFCADKDLAEPSFYAWRRTIAERDAAAVRFVPVHIVPGEQPVAADSGSNSGLELVLPAGRRLRIGPGFDAATLQRLLAVLEEGRP